MEFVQNVLFLIIVSTGIRVVRLLTLFRVKNVSMDPIRKMGSVMNVKIRQIVSSMTFTVVQILNIVLTALFVMTDII
jgi:hypothetical protein